MLCKKLLESYSVALKPSIPHELLLVDNSTDTSSSEELKSLAKQFGVVYLHSEQGVVKARNKGAENAKYRYLLFVDSDCTLDENVLIEYETLAINADPACAAGKTLFTGKESIWWKGIKDILISANTPFSLRRVPQGRADVPSVDEEHGCAASGSEFC